jgi:hypothetical protein
MTGPTAGVSGGPASDDVGNRQPHLGSTTSTPARLAISESRSVSAGHSHWVAIEDDATARQPEGPGRPVGHVQGDPADLRQPYVCRAPRSDRLGGAVSWLTFQAMLK